LPKKFGISFACTEINVIFDCELKQHTVEVERCQKAEAGKPPGRGLGIVEAAANPGVNAWATEKTDLAMFSVPSVMNNPGEAVP